jgi:hypothetical protein
MDDLWKLSPADSVTCVSKSFDAHWREELGRRGKPRLVRDASGSGFRVWGFARPVVVQGSIVAVVVQGSVVGLVLVSTPGVTEHNQGTLGSTGRAE